MKCIPIDDAPKGIIPACDATLEKVGKIAQASDGKKRVTALKVGGIKPTLRHGLPKVIDTIRSYNKETPIIFDYQKAGNDIPDLGPDFAGEVKDAGADAVIIFPFGGEETARAWIKSCQDVKLGVIVGAHMTQKKFLASEGGVISNPKLLYSIAIDMGIRNFVVPGNKVEFVKEYYQFLKDKIPGGRFRLHAPGFLAQNGEISEMGAVAGDLWDAIIGRGLTKYDTAAEIATAIDNFTAQMDKTKPTATM
jgi:orotidine-5'-phosphate decarboxylase